MVSSQNAQRGQGQPVLIAQMEAHSIVAAKNEMGSADPKNTEAEDIPDI